MRPAASPTAKVEIAVAVEIEGGQSRSGGGSRRTRLRCRRANRDRQTGLCRCPGIGVLRRRPHLRRRGVRYLSGRRRRCHRRQCRRGVGCRRSRCVLGPSCHSRSRRSPRRNRPAGFCSNTWTPPVTNASPITRSGRPSSLKSAIRRLVVPITVTFTTATRRGAKVPAPSFGTGRRRQRYRPQRGNRSPRRGQCRRRQRRGPTRVPARPSVRRTLHPRLRGRKLDAHAHAFLGADNDELG